MSSALRHYVDRRHRGGRRCQPSPSRAGRTQGGRDRGDETRDLRRGLARQLNKGESLHALRRDLRYAHGGTFRSPHLTGQSERAWCLTLLTNAVVAWTSDYLRLAVAVLRAEGRYVNDEALAHISPARSETVNFFGAISVEIDTELAKLDATGYRPLRSFERAVPPFSMMTYAVGVTR
ncbi:Tn3 family transposase [[Actinomadura] parvosata]|uniref:Tn3 family transposase n=1 Tax=[Actinomadura] parvosata TaxID=1955412 RepID=UPI00406C8FEA